MINLVRRYPDSKPEDITDAFSRGVICGMAVWRGTCHPIISDNLNESEGMGDAWANCSECGYPLCVLTNPSSQMPNYCPNCGRKVVDE